MTLKIPTDTQAITWLIIGLFFSLGRCCEISHGYARAQGELELDGNNKSDHYFKLHWPFGGITQL